MQTHSWLLAFGLFACAASAACTRDKLDTSADAAAAPGADASSKALAPSAASPSATGASRRGDAGKPASAPTISAADRRAALRALDEGRKLARARDYKGALAALERALVVDPADARVLAEVGYAALEDGQVARAEQASHKALAHTQDPRLRAQILYNLGRAEEARGESALARASYAASLELRDNDVVKRRLASVTGDAAASPQVVTTNRLPCRAPVADVTAACACLLADKSDYLLANSVPDLKPPSCGEESSAPPLGDPRLFLVTWSKGELGETAHLLAMRDGSRVHVLADLGHDYEPGACGIHVAAEVKGGAPKTVDGHAAVVVRSEERHADYNMGGLELCTEWYKLETICALGGDAGAPRCTASIPASLVSGCGLGVEPDPKELDDETRAARAEIKARTSSSSAQTSWSIGPSGDVIVKLVPGSAKDVIPTRSLGPHQL